MRFGVLRRIGTGFDGCGILRRLIVGGGFVCVTIWGYMFRLWRSCYLSSGLLLHVLHHSGHLHQRYLNKETLVVGVTETVFEIGGYIEILH